jgi:hypothetical protein
MTCDLGAPRQKPCDVLGRARNNRRALEERITAVAPVGGGKIKAVFPKWFAPSRISSRLGSLQFLELWAPTRSSANVSPTARLTGIWPFLLYNSPPLLIYLSPMVLHCCLLNPECHYFCPNSPFTACCVSVPFPSKLQ